MLAVMGAHFRAVKIIYWRVSVMDQMNQSLASLLPEGMQWLVGPLIALLVIIAGYFISKILAGLVAGAINRTGLGRKAKTTGGNIGKSISKAFFWVLWLIFILLGLSQFPLMNNALEPIQGMLNGVWGYLPQLAVGALVLVIGAGLSKVVKEATTSTLEVAQVDNLASKFGFAGADEASSSKGIASGIGGLLSAIVMIFAAITAIGIWDIPGISGPVSEMLETVLSYIPNVITAALALAIAVFIGRFVSNLIQNTLPALGVDNSLKALGSLDGTSASNVVPSKVIANISFIGIILMGLTAAMSALNIPALTEVFETLLAVGGRVVLGAVIIGAGLFIANFVSKIVTQTSGDLAGKIIKYATMLIVTFMGLETMQLGEGIVDTTFKYGVGAAAVAGAVAFGLGGREWAGKKLQDWLPAKTTRKK